MKNKIRNSNVGLELNGCLKAEEVVCGCGKSISPYGYMNTLLGGFKYYYKCDNCNQKYTTRNKNGRISMDIGWIR